MTALPAELTCDTISYSLVAGFIIYALNGSILFSGECSREQLSSAIGEDTATTLLKSVFLPDWCRIFGNFIVSTPVSTNRRTYLAGRTADQQFDDCRLENLVIRAAEQTASLRSLYVKIAELLDKASAPLPNLSNSKLAFLRAQSASQLDSTGAVMPITPQCLATLRTNWAAFTQSQ